AVAGASPPRGHRGSRPPVFLMTRARVLAVALLLVSGCGFSGRALRRNLDAPSEPAKIAHKVRDPTRLDARLAVLRVGHSTALLPPGARSAVPRYAFESRELDRWQSYDGAVRVTAVPVRHVGGRWGIDQAWNVRAFKGYVFEHHGLSVYYAGDTAFDPDDFV